MKKMTRRFMMRTTGLAAGAAGLAPSALGTAFRGMASAAGATGIPDWGLGPFVRDDGADHIGPRPESAFPCPVTGKVIPWENKDILAPSAVVKDGQVFLLYRAEDRSRGESWGTSRIGLAVSSDGRHFKRHPVPVLYPDNDFMKEYEWPGGCQDPRIAQAEDGTYVMTYTAWDGETARLCCATSKDLYQWTKHGLAIGTCHKGKYRDFWSKSGAIVCRREGSQFIAQRIHGKYWMYFNDSGAMIATSDNLTDWNVVEDSGGKFLTVLPKRPGMMDSSVVEPGPPAFLTDKGILLIYNAGAKGRPDLGLTGDVWAVSQALFDPSDPTKLIDRMDHDFFHPERDFERKHAGSTAGGFNNVTFVENLVWFNGEWRFYYDCADSIVASAAYRPAEGTKRSLR
jgi:predicted GH43/DUF377 family glycosyl hydrolase